MRATKYYARVALAAVIATATAACSSAQHQPERSPPGRSVAAIRACLNAHHLPVSNVPRNSTLPDRLRPRPTTLLAVNSGPGALLVVYASTSAAARVHEELRRSLPTIQQGPVLIIFLILPQPGPALRVRLESCAFGRIHRPSIGPMVTTPTTGTTPSVKATTEPSNSAEARRSPRERAGQAARCHIDLRYIGSTSGTEQVFALFTVRNAAGRPCGLYRYPRVQLLGLANRPIPEAQQDGGDGALPSLKPAEVLPTHRTAHFLLAFAPLTASGGRCLPARTAIVTFGPGAVSRVGLSIRLSKEREPIAPCPHTGFSVTATTAGLY